MAIRNNNNNRNHTTNKIWKVIAWYEKRYKMNWQNAMDFVLQDLTSAIQIYERNTTNNRNANNNRNTTTHRKNL
jgi:hypothetical protein